MDLQGLIAAKKASVRTGDWKRGEIPRAQWPSRRAKAKAYKFSDLYQWRIISFSAEGQDCRVRILLNESKQIFRASFGVTVAGETTTLCEYEWHASEPGWHCHARCDDFAKLDPSFNRFGAQRIPAYGRHHRRTEFKFRKSPLTAFTAFNCAVEVFKIDRGDGVL